MAAAIQWATTSDRPVLLDYEKEAGHAGGWARGLSATERICAIARQIAFLNTTRFDPVASETSNEAQVLR